MVNFCVIVGCGSRGQRDAKSFHRLPAVISNQCKRALELNQLRRDTLIRRISRADLDKLNTKNIRICSDHFISGKFSSENCHPINVSDSVIAWHHWYHVTLVWADALSGFHIYDGGWPADQTVRSVHIWNYANTWWTQNKVINVTLRNMTIKTAIVK